MINLNGKLSIQEKSILKFRRDDMIQVKEFINDVEGKINKWIEENNKNIKVIDIKYQLTVINYHVYTKALIIYEKII